MMNQRIVIYIILSAFLLYLYYRRRDLAIFAVFVVVVGSTLIFRDGGASASEGFGGGSGKVDSECAKMGFTALKFVKDDDGDIRESFEKEMKKIKKVVDKHWPYDANGDTKDETEQKSIQVLVDVWTKEVKEQGLSGEDKTSMDKFMEISKYYYDAINNIDEKKRIKIEIKPNEIPKGRFKEMGVISGGITLLKVLENLGSKSSELKDAGAKKLIKYLICLCKHWNAIYNKIESMAGGKKSGSDKKKSKKGADGDGDEEEKPKKKKTTKDENAEDDE